MHAGVQLDVDFYGVVGSLIECVGVSAVGGCLNQIVGGEQVDLVRGGVAQYQNIPLDSVKAQVNALLDGGHCEGVDAQVV